MVGEVKRGRGRPPGSKNKKRKLSPKPDAAPPTATAGRRPRGRPPKAPKHFVPAQMAANDLVELTIQVGRSSRGEVDGMPCIVYTKRATRMGAGGDHRARQCAAAGVARQAMALGTPAAAFARAFPPAPPPLALAAPSRACCARPFCTPLYTPHHDSHIAHSKHAHTRCTGALSSAGSTARFGSTTQGRSCRSGCVRRVQGFGARPAVIEVRGATSSGWVNALGCKVLVHVQHALTHITRSQTCTPGGVSRWRRGVDSLPG